MDLSTNHDNNDSIADYGLRIYEETETGSNSAEIAVRIDEFIDSRRELDTEIRKRALEFLKRAVSELEKELSVR
ncbi:hypothetical protein ACHCAK_22360 [Raoultella ornithinolytica]|uniref:hypothetical protein n=1 Tax=Raoultella ornithinolytica TaxID=54291 RepID=UPI00227682DD|nr:hypothetical protein [Raoultella ornithinolytica]EKU0200085.1 hypothetical protein [Raoultella ornithinolytica]EKU0200692.1 hypothetical protein [Raoultella ornithinolytica]EKV4103463.1 hypothetical protein [Raoultella ornithinolytica]EKV8288462.1 hypothetical protein [Raoultella ornithinolytica]